MAVNGKFTLERWIHAACNDQDKRKADGVEVAACTSITVCHMQGTEAREIHTIHLDGRQEPQSMARLLRSKAEAYCSELPGKQTCCLQAFYEESESPQATQPFGVDGQMDLGGNGLMTESPTTNGQLQQAMRHNEALMQGAFGAMNKAFEYMQRAADNLSRQNEALARDNASLREENADAFNVVRDITMAAADTRHEKMMQQLEHQRKTDERKRWLKMAPMLINTVLGREVFPAGNADTALVETIAESLSDDDFGKLASAFGGKPELMGPLMARFNAAMEKKQKEDANAADAQALALGAGDEYGSNDDK